MKLTLQLLLSSLLVSLSLQKGLYSWKYFEYDWLNEKQRENYVKEGLYLKNASTPIDALIANGKIFVAIPRFPGVPAAIGTLNRNKIKGGGPVVTPYPNWGWANMNKKCNETIISVYRIDIDKCNRLWVLDNGKNGSTIVCPPKLIVFDLKTNKVVLQKEIPSKYAANSNGTGLLVTPLVVTYGYQCQRITVYMADIEGYGLVIWRGGDDFQRFESSAFANDPKHSNYDIDGDKMTLNDGIVGLALHIAGPNLNCPSFYCNTLYLTALSSYDMYHVSVNSLKNNNNTNIEVMQDNGHVDYHKAALAIEGDSIYFSTIEDYALRKWNVKTNFTKKNAKIIKQDKKLLNFVSGLKILRKSSYNTSNCTRIYGLSNKFERTGANTRNTSEINYNIFMYTLCDNEN